MASGMFARVTPFCESLNVAGWCKKKRRSKKHFGTAQVDVYRECWQDAAADSAKSIQSSRIKQLEIDQSASNIKSHGHKSNI